MINKVISHYQILEKLGRGGMGEVYLAMDLELDRKVAIKFLPQHLTSNPENVERFKREARLAAALNHINIITIFDIIKAEEQYCIVMEYVDGITLRQMISESDTLPYEKILLILEQLIDGLKKAHQAGIVHRDLKPENIIIDREGKVKILDFGLAKLKGSIKLTQENARIGTLHYMSPEQYQGEELDQRSDIWSLGIILYEMVTGSVPFKGEYDAAIMYAVLNETAPPIANNVATHGLEAIIYKCLAKDRSDRYQSIDEIEAVFLNKEQPSPAEVPKKNRFRSGFLYKIGFFVLVAAIIGLIFLLAVKESESTPPIPIAVVDFVNETGDADLNGLSGMLATAFEQSRKFSVVTRSQMFDILKQLNKENVPRIDEELGREIANRAGIKILVLASIRKFDQLFNIDLKVLDPIENKYLYATSEKEEGKSNIPAMIDRLAESTREGLEESKKDISKTMVPVEEITTSNLEAYKHYFLGDEFLNRLEINKAQNEFRQAIRLDSTFGLAYYGLAFSWDWEYNAPAAKWYIRKAMNYIDKIPEKEKYLIRAYYDYIYHGPKAGLMILRKMEKTYPDQKQMLYYIGSWSSQLRKYAESEIYLNRAISIDPKFEPALNDLFGIYTKQKEFNKALEVAENYVKISEENYYALIMVYKNLNRFDEIEERLNKECEKYPEKKNPVFVALGWTYRKSGDLATAEKYLLKAVAARPSDYRANLYLGYLNEEKGNIKASKAYLKTAIALDSSNTDILMSLYYFFMREKEVSEAIYYGEKLFQIEPYHLKMAINLCKNFYEQKNYARALYYGKRALELEPMYFRDSYNLYTTLGSIYHEINENENAIVFFKKAITIDSVRFEAYYGLAQSFDHLHDTNQALQNLRKALYYNPSRNQDVKKSIEVNKFNSQDSVSELIDEFIKYTNSFAEKDSVEITYKIEGEVDWGYLVYSVVENNQHSRYSVAGYLEFPWEFSYKARRGDYLYLFVQGLGFSDTLNVTIYQNNMILKQERKLGKNILVDIGLRL